MNTSKQEIVNIIRENSSLFQQVGIHENHEYMTKCNYCGDTSDPTRGHMYLCIDYDDPSPIAFNCARCGMGGYITSVERLSEIIGREIRAEEIKDIKFQRNVGLKQLNRNIYFDYTIPKSKVLQRKYDYLSERIGFDPTWEDVEHIRFIPSLKEFIMHNHINKEDLSLQNTQIDFIDRCTVPFLSNGNSHIIYRILPEYVQTTSWYSVPIVKQSVKNRVFYSLPIGINPYEYSDKNINLAEGVFDILSAYYNIQKKSPGIYIAVKGNKYNGMIRYLINMGIFGSDVMLNIYSDNDKIFNKKNGRRVKTDVHDFVRNLQGLPYLFKNESINIYYNQVSKDIGVGNDNIVLKKVII